jgi:two-component system response regulator NreC
LLRGTIFTARPFKGSGEIEVIGLANGGEAVLEMARRDSPDVILMDASLPPSSGIAVTNDLRREKFACKVLLLTQYEHELDLQSAFRIGVNGFLSKKASHRDLAGAIAAVARGDYFVHLSIAGAPAGGCFDSVSQPGGQRDFGKLTRREREILMLVADGSRTGEVASRLGIAVKTVSGHRANMMKKLDIHSQTELVKYAIYRQMNGLSSWESRSEVGA